MTKNTFSKQFILLFLIPEVRYYYTFLCLLTCFHKKCLLRYRIFYDNFIWVYISKT